MIWEQIKRFFEEDRYAFCKISMVLNYDKQESAITIDKVAFLKY